MKDLLSLVETFIFLPKGKIVQSLTVKNQEEIETWLENFKENPQKQMEEREQKEKQEQEQERQQDQEREQREQQKPSLIRENKIFKVAKAVLKNLSVDSDMRLMEIQREKVIRDSVAFFKDGMP